MSLRCPILGPTPTPRSMLEATGRAARRGVLIWHRFLSKPRLMPLVSSRWRSALRGQSGTAAWRVGRQKSEGCASASPISHLPAWWFASGSHLDFTPPCLRAFPYMRLIQLFLGDVALVTYGAEARTENEFRCKQTRLVAAQGPQLQWHSTRAIAR